MFVSFSIPIPVHAVDVLRVFLGLMQLLLTGRRLMEQGKVVEGL